MLQEFKKFARVFPRLGPYPFVGVPSTVMPLRCHFSTHVRAPLPGSLCLITAEHRNYVPSDHSRPGRTSGRSRRVRYATDRCQKR